MKWSLAKFKMTEHFGNMSLRIESAEKFSAENIRVHFEMVLK